MNRLVLDFGVASPVFNATPSRLTLQPEGDSTPTPAPAAPPPNWRCCLAIGCTQHIEPHHIYCGPHWQMLPGFVRDELCRQHNRLHRWHCPDARQKYRETIMASIDVLWAIEEEQILAEIEAANPPQQSHFA